MEQSELVSQFGEANASHPYLSRDSAVNPTTPHPARRKGHPLLWGLGGTLLSIVGFVLMLLFEQYNDLVTELRNDLKHFNETYSEFVKKEYFRRLSDQVKECRREMTTSSAARLQLEQELRAAERAREELTKELQRLRERLASVEGRQAATPILIPVPHTTKNEDRDSPP